MKHRHIHIAILIVAVVAFAATAFSVFTDAGYGSGAYGEYGSGSNGNGSRGTAYAAEQVDYATTLSTDYLELGISEGQKGARFLRYLNDTLTTTHASTVTITLTTDIYLLDVINVTPIGSEGTPAYDFVFDGGYHSIVGLNLYSYTENYAGLFSNVMNAEIRNLTLRAFTISRAAANIGDIPASSLAGALAGIAENTTFYGISVENAIVNGTNYVGGLVGAAFGGRVELTRVSGAVTGVSELSGLVGLAWSEYNDFEIINSYSIATVSKATIGTGYNHIGGLVGDVLTTPAYKFSIIGSYFNGKISATGIPVGGLLGVNPVGLNYELTSSYHGAYGNIGTQFEPYPLSTPEVRNAMAISVQGVTLFSSYKGWNFKDIWAFDGNAGVSESMFGYAPDFVRNYDGTTGSNSTVVRLTLASLPGMTLDEEAVIGAPDRTVISVADGSNIRIPFVTPVGYSLTVAYLRDGTANDLNNIVPDGRLGVDYDVATQTVTIKNLRQDVVFEYMADSPNYLLSFERYAFSDVAAGLYKGFLSVTANPGDFDETNKPGEVSNNYFYGSFKYDSEMQFTFETYNGDVASMSNVYRAVGLKIGGVSVANFAALVGPNNDTGTFYLRVSEIIAAAAAGNPTYTTPWGAVSADENENRYLFMEIIWEALPCAIELDIECIGGGELEGRYGSISVLRIGYGLEYLYTGKADNGGQRFTLSAHMGETLRISAIPLDIGDGPMFVFMGWIKETNSGRELIPVSTTPAEFEIFLNDSAKNFKLIAQFKRLWDQRFYVNGPGEIRFLNAEYGVDYLLGNALFDGTVTGITADSQLYGYLIPNYGEFLKTLAGLSGDEQQVRIAAKRQECVLIDGGSYVSYCTLRLPNQVAISVDFVPFADDYYGTMSIETTDGVIYAKQGVNNITASFMPRMYSLALSVDSRYATYKIENGKVSYIKGETAKITVSAVKGYKFAAWYNNSADNTTKFIPVSEGWTGDAKGVYTCEFVVDRNITLKATFEPMHTITVALDSPSGKIAGSVPYANGAGGYNTAQIYSLDFAEGDEAVFYLRVYEGYAFRSAKIVSSDIMVYFTAVSEDISTEIRPDGTRVNYRLYRMNREVGVVSETVNVWFDRVVFNVTIKSEDTDKGTVLNSGTRSYGFNANVEIRALPRDGYEFVRWIYKTADPDKPAVYLLSANYSFTVEEAVTLTAEFKKMEAAENTYYTVTLISSDGISDYGLYEAGIPKRETGSFERGTVISARARTAPGYMFVGWYYANSDGTPNTGIPTASDFLDYTFTVSENSVLIPVARKMIFRVTVLNGSAYMIAADNKSLEPNGVNSFTFAADYDEVLLFSVTVNAGYKFNYWIINGESTNAYLFTYSYRITADLTVAAAIEIASDNAGTGGTATVRVDAECNPAMGDVAGVGEIAAGKIKTITARPKPGYEFVHWLNEAGQVYATTASISVTTTENVLFTAVFKLAVNEILVAKNGGGSVDVDASIIYLETKTATIKCESGYKIKSVKLNGVEVSAAAGQSEFDLELTGNGSAQTITVTYQMTSLPAWAWYALGGALVLLLIVLLVLIVLFRRRKFRES
ncbi:MAG: InlB B-repeat-containing protein [Clostridiaceae bacterium]|jgi:hypothetical protein|nr:InlB B-repeat-containing protein [Clostridiaceae bacterium]